MSCTNILTSFLMSQIFTKSFYKYVIIQKLQTLHQITSLNEILTHSLKFSVHIVSGRNYIINAAIKDTLYKSIITRCSYNTELYTSLKSNN